MSQLLCNIPMMNLLRSKISFLFAWSSEVRCSWSFGDGCCDFSNLLSPNSIYSSYNPSRLWSWKHDLNLGTCGLPPKNNVKKLQNFKNKFVFGYDFTNEEHTVFFHLFYHVRCSFIFTEFWNNATLIFLIDCNSVVGNEK